MPMHVQNILIYMHIYTVYTNIVNIHTMFHYMHAYILYIYMHIHSEHQYMHTDTLETDKKGPLNHTPRSKTHHRPLDRDKGLHLIKTGFIYISFKIRLGNLEGPSG